MKSRTTVVQLRLAGRAAMVAACLLLMCAAAAGAQDAALRLTAGRDWGFSLGNQMQGRFTFTVSGPYDLASAALVMDGRQIATADQAPFRFPLDTGSYPTGRHTMSATARTVDGRPLHSNDLDVQFVGTGQAWESSRRVLIPLFAVVLGIVAIGTLGSAWLAGRSTKSRASGARVYGPAGGAICPKCDRPFPLSLWQPNVPPGKLARCPYCGKWSIVRRAAPAVLAAAEARETADAQPAVPEMSPEEKLRRQVEESRYR